MHYVSKAGRRHSALGEEFEHISVKPVTRSQGHGSRPEETHHRSHKERSPTSSEPRESPERAAEEPERGAWGRSSGANLEALVAQNLYGIEKGRGWGMEEDLGPD